MRHIDVEVMPDEVTSDGLKYGDNCDKCGNVFMPETPCDFGYCDDLIREELGILDSIQMLRES